MMGSSIDAAGKCELLDARLTEYPCTIGVVQFRGWPVRCHLNTGQRCSSEAAAASCLTHISTSGTALRKTTQTVLGNEG